MRLPFTPFPTVCTTSLQSTDRSASFRFNLRFSQAVAEKKAAAKAKAEVKAKEHKGPSFSHFMLF